LASSAVRALTVTLAVPSTLSLVVSDHQPHHGPLRYPLVHRSVKLLADREFDRVLLLARVLHSDVRDADELRTPA
jgi:hypothetical protein